MINFILGVLFWQFIVFIVLIASNENEDTVISFGCGVPLFLHNMAIRILRCVWRRYVRKAYVLVKLMRKEDEKTTSYNPLLKVLRVRKDKLKEYYRYGENEYYVELYETKRINVEAYNNIEKYNNGWFNQEWIALHYKKKK